MARVVRLTTSLAAVAGARFVVFVKRECETSAMVAPVLRELTEALDLEVTCIA